MSSPDPSRRPLRSAFAPLFGEIRFALRTLSRSPGYATAVILTLALAIGANSAIFSLVDGVLLRPLPYEHGERLVVLDALVEREQNPRVDFSVQEVYDLRARTHTLDAVVEHHGMSFFLLGRAEPERVSTGVVSANFFDVLGVEPLAGRLFEPSDEKKGAEAVLVLGWEFWKSSFGGDAGVVGEVFEMNDQPHRVVGVLPPIPQWPATHDVYMPTAACPFRARGEEMRHQDRDAFRNLTVFGRVARSKAPDAVESELGSLAAEWKRDHPEVYGDVEGFDLDAEVLARRLAEGARTTLFLLVATAALVLLIACANVANLGMARLLGRRRELAVRSALGAGRRTLLRQLLVESTLLAVAGAGVGLLLARGTLDVLKRFVARFSPRAVDVALDERVLLFTLLLAVVVGIAAGALPLLHVRRGSVSEALRDGSHGTEDRGRSRLRGALVTAQVAVSVVLLAAAGLFLESLLRLQSVDAGFGGEQVVTAEIPLDWSVHDEPEDAIRHLSRIEAELAGIPGVRSVAVGNGLPLRRQAPSLGSLRVEGDDPADAAPAPRVDVRIASREYFRTLGISLQEGRVFELGDDLDAPEVAVVSRSLANGIGRLRGEGWNPLGRRISVDGGDTWPTVVGVVDDVRQHGLDRPPSPTVYLPLAQTGFGSTLFLRSSRDVGPLMRDVKTAVWRVAPQQVVSNPRTLAELRRESTATPRTATILVSLFAGLALLITIAGVGSVVAYAIGRRRRELGLRLALGARRGQILGLVLAQGLTLVGAGLAVGLAGALAGQRYLEPFLYLGGDGGELASRLLVLGAVVGMLLLTAVLACVLPARRALRVDPTTALREE